MFYDIIIRQNLMQEMGIDILNSSKTFKWDEQEISIQPRSTMVTKMMQSLKDPIVVKIEIKKIEKILDAKYEPADLKQVTKNISDLSKKDKDEIY